MSEAIINGSDLLALPFPAYWYNSDPRSARLREKTSMNQSVIMDILRSQQGSSLLPAFRRQIF